MPIPDYVKKNIADFFSAIAPLREAYGNCGFSYVAVAHNGAFVLLQGALFFNMAPTDLRAKQFKSLHVRAGYYPLETLELSAEEVISALLAGSLPTPDGELRFPDTSGNYNSSFTPFHTVGLQNQQRLNVLGISGDHQTAYVQQPMIDWELKAASVPYENLQELMFDYKLGLFRGNTVIVEAIAYNVALVRFDSKVDSTKAYPDIRAAVGLDPTKLTLNYRVLSQGKVIERKTVDGTGIKWVEEDGFRRGIAEIDIAEGSLICCTISYQGIAQHFAWLLDQSKIMNPRRAAFEAFDEKLQATQNIIANAQGRGIDARDFEAAISWLLWMLGFSVAYLGGTRRTSAAADIIVTTPNGHFAVVECTTGILKAENKLALLHERTQTLKKSLEPSHRHLNVLPVIVTSKTREDIKPDLPLAEELGISVVTHEDIERVFQKTLLLPDAEKIYNEALQETKAAQQLGDAQGVLALNPAD
jgi:hypothetical protein